MPIYRRETALQPLACNLLTVRLWLCIYESWQACNPTPSAETATGASSNPFAIRAEGRASASCVISVPQKSFSNAFPRLQDVLSTLRSEISVPLPHFGTQLNNWISFEPSIPMHANETRDLRWASTSFLPP